MTTQPSSPSGASSPATILEDLRQCFANYRKEHETITRFPTDMRQAVLKALDAGVTQSDITAACGVTPRQVTRWQATITEADSRNKRYPQTVSPAVASDFRVLNVTDPPPATPSEGPTPPLELRIGNWRICIEPLTTPQS